MTPARKIAVDPAQEPGGAKNVPAGAPGPVVDLSGWEVRATWRVLAPGLAHPETTNEHRPSEWRALLHAGWLVRAEADSTAVQVARIEIRDPGTGWWRTVHDPAAALDAVAEIARRRASGQAPGPGEGSGA